MVDVTDAVHVIKGTGPVLLTAEHASNRLPPRWDWQGQEHLATQHWGIDLGIAPLTEALATSLGAPAVLARFTRLLVDPNRPVDSPTLFRDRADGHPVNMNALVTPEGAARRIAEYYEPYHAAIDAQLAQHKCKFLLSMHSFTPLYEGAPRSVEIGVLHPGNSAALAEQWRDALATTGRDVRVNEPYTGSNGYMYSAETHADRFGIPCIELEVRQDLLEDTSNHAEFVTLITAALQTS
ncbi:MAG: putative N-formylglutamate amidohydrolase [Myxococcota bacterium]|jgi:predicted N-formylglutamate amidohydrolase